MNTIVDQLPPIMNILKEQRDSVMKENNIAQDQLISALEDLNKSVTAIRMYEPFYGDLDFSVLHDMGFNELTKIDLPEGEITSIRNLPNTITSFECPKNLLVELEDLPDSLTHLEVPFNFLTHLDISHLSKLEKLNVNHNQLAQLDNIPSKMTDLLCENNKLRKLDLASSPNIRVLHINDNRILLIENLPEGIVDFQMDNNPGIEFRNSPNIPHTKTTEHKAEVAFAKKATYLENLKLYFKLKDKYESDNKKVQRKTYRSAPTKRMAKAALLNILPKCVNCKRPVGTIFETKDRYHTAVCGDRITPCKLHLKIYNGSETMSLYTALDIYREDIDRIKETIIKRKLDTLFAYVTEAESVKLFKNELLFYNEASELYKPILDRYTELYFSSAKEALLAKKEGDVFHLNERIHMLLEEYQASENPEIIKTAMTMYHNELIPEIRNVRMLKYEAMHIEEEQKEEFTLVSTRVTLEHDEFRSVDFAPNTIA